MITRDMLAAFFDEFEKIAAEIGMPAPASITAINQPVRGMLPSPASMVQGNAQHVPWGQSSASHRVQTAIAGRRKNLAFASTQAMAPIRQVEQRAAPVVGKAVTGLLKRVAA